MSITVLAANKLLFIITSPCTVNVPVVITTLSVRLLVLVVRAKVRLPVTVAVAVFMFKLWLMEPPEGWLMSTSPFTVNVVPVPSVKEVLVALFAKLMPVQITFVPVVMVPVVMLIRGRLAAAEPLIVLLVPLNVIEPMFNALLL